MKCALNRYVSYVLDTEQYYSTLKISYVILNSYVSFHVFMKVQGTDGIIILIVDVARTARCALYFKFSLSRVCQINLVICFSLNHLQILINKLARPLSFSS
jgi:hypothetical protein